MPKNGWQIEPRIFVPDDATDIATVDRVMAEIRQIAREHGGGLSGVGYGRIDIPAPTREEARVGLFSATTDAPVKLGERYRDTITGFEGVATARYEFLHGCVRILLEGQKDGQPAEFTFDEQRLTEKPAATSGGPRPAPPSRDPAR